MFRIGIDLGGTKIEGIVLDPKGSEMARRRIPTEQEKGYDGILDNIRNLYRTLVDSIQGAPHTFGIGTPGSISVRTQRLRNSNTVCMNGRPVKEDIEERLGRRIEIQNDANCFAMAEAMLGAGRGHAFVFGVILGTGCGGGMVYNGRVISGLQGLGGEWGHMSIDPDGPPCFCGRRGCVETFISGGGLENRYEERYGIRRRLKDIEEDYRAGQPEAKAFMEGFFLHFGLAMANLITVLDPDIIVLGGGVSKFDALYTEGVRAVSASLPSAGILETPIVKHQIGDSAGVIGAALIGV